MNASMRQPATPALDRIADLVELKAALAELGAGRALGRDSS